MQWKLGHLLVDLAKIVVIQAEEVITHKGDVTRIVAGVLRKRARLLWTCKENLTLMIARRRLPRTDSLGMEKGQRGSEA